MEKDGKGMEITVLRDNYDYITFFASLISLISLIVPKTQQFVETNFEI